MVDAALVYVTGVVVLFFFWMYGVVAFLRDVKNWLVPAYRQWRAEETDHGPNADERAGDGAGDVLTRSGDVDE